MQVQQNKDKLWEAGFIFRGSESPEVRRKSLNKSSELAPTNAGLASWQVSGQQGPAQFHSLVGRRSRWITVTKPLILEFFRSESRFDPGGTRAAVASETHHSAGICSSSSSGCLSLLLTLAVVSRNTATTMAAMPMNSDFSGRSWRRKMPSSTATMGFT